MPDAEHVMKVRLALDANVAFFRFYGELNDFLPPQRRGRLVSHRFDVAPSVKDAIESLGVPHPEVELIVVNHQPVGFGHPVRRGDYVSVYPVFHSIDLGCIPQLRPRLEARAGFVLDVHLGRLAGYLRLLGFDTLYRNDFSDEDIARIAATQSRVVFTRDRGLLKRNDVQHGYWVRHVEPRRQLLEVLRRFDLARRVDLFTRCLVCNSVLEKVEREAVLARVPERTAGLFQDFHSCPGCGRIYWKGSHYRRMLQLVGKTLRAARG